MLSFFKHVYNLFDYEKHTPEVCSKKLEELEIAVESELRNECPEDSQREEDSEQINETLCYQKIGVITSISGEIGLIDKVVMFNTDLAYDFKVGDKVNYLTYKQPGSDFYKVVKVNLFESSWDNEELTDDYIEKTIDEVKETAAKTYGVHQRSLVGQIISRNGQFLVVDTDHTEVTVDLDKVITEFVPKEGDRVYLECNVQTDEDFADLSGEVLEVKQVHPGRTKQYEGTVTKLHGEWGVINSDCYFTEDIFQNGLEVQVGDKVKCNVIECERGIFIWRCLSIEVPKRTPLEKAPPVVPKKETPKVITITEDIGFFFSQILEEQEFEVVLTNNSERPHTVQRVETNGVRRNSQLNLDKLVVPMVIGPKQAKTVKLVCSSKFFGVSKEKLIFVFDNFKIFRTVEISVGLSGVEDKINTDHQFNGKQRRLYAHKVLLNKTASIPGVRPMQLARFVAQKIPMFEVPKRLRDALLMDVSRSYQIKNLENLYPWLTQDLDINNYTQRFSTLLFIEEIEYFVTFRQLDMKRAHFKHEGEYLSLVIENLVDRRPSLMVGDTVRAFNIWEDKSAKELPYDGCIHKVLYDRVLIKFESGFHSQYNGEDYRLEFYFSRFCFRKQHYALEKIVKLRGEHFLFPSQIVLSDTLQLNADLDSEGNLLVNGRLAENQWYNKNLNTVQRCAVKNILRGEARALPYVVFGPPGTGKTVTIVEAIVQLVKNLPNCRILVGSPTNSAADLITTRLVESGAMNPGEFVRLVSQRLIERELIPDHLKPFCATIDIAEDGSAENKMMKTESGIKLKCQARYLGRHKVTIGTCLTLGNFMQMRFPKEHFTHVIIDECGQCNEPELMTPMCLLAPNFGQVILAGDPYQLGPVVVNTYAGDKGLNVSFLDRLIVRNPYMKDKVRFPETSRDQRLVTKLIYNYRALPSVLRTYNKLFYESELQPMIAPEDGKEAKLLRHLNPILPPSETRLPNHGVFFHGVVGVNQQDSDSPSWYNTSEASHVVCLVGQLLARNVSPDQIGIITPYQKQVKVIRQLLVASGFKVPKVGTVEEFQGQERDVIVLSIVRSSKNLLDVDVKFALGFASAPKRLNVAISRARSLLYICGNPHLLSLTNEWRFLISYCLDNDAYSGCDLPNCLQNE